ncbi:MAG: phosphoribosylglycinamide formyltransferase [Pseudomonadota bacterium]
MTSIRIAILVSGRGSNMEAILKASAQEDYPAEPVLVLSNRPDANALTIAAQAGISAVSVDHKPFGKDREAFECAMQTVLVEHDVEMIVLAGFMRILTPWFVGQWSDRMINIHPSLLPKYAGLNTHQRAIDAGDQEAGCTAHWVTEGVDQGDAIAQARVAIEPDETAESLAQKVLVEEHKLYPEAVKLACAEVLKSKGAAKI